MKATVGVLLTVIERACVAALSLLMFAAVAVAQTAPAPAEPTAPVKAPRKVKHKEPPQPQPAQQQPQPQAPQAPQQPSAFAPTQQPPVVYSPWTKICPKPPPNAPQLSKQVCLTVREVRLETGQFLAGAALIEQEGEPKKLLRITLPLGMQIPPGTRITLDTEQPLSAGFVVCVPNGCMSDYQVDADFVGKLKKGQQILLQGINTPGQVAGYVLPLADFGKANDGPPTDPEQFEAAQKKIWEERLRQQQQQQQTAPPK